MHSCGQAGIILCYGVASGLDSAEWTRTQASWRCDSRIASVEVWANYVGRPQERTPLCCSGEAPGPSRVAMRFGSFSVA